MTTEEHGENQSENKLALYDPISAGIAGLAEKYKDGPGDLSIKENYEACRKAVAETREIRGKTEKLRKELKADALEYGRRVDSLAKGIIEKVLAIEEPWAAAKKAYDTKIEIEKREKALAEERRVDAIYTRITAISNLPSLHISSSSRDIEALFPGLNGDLVTCDEWAQEFSDKARAALAETKAKLEELHSMKLQQEQFEAEKAKAEKEAAEKAEAERIKREKEAAEERARLAQEREALEKERAAINEALEKERAAIQAEKDRMAAEQAERDRIAKEEQAARDRAAAEDQAAKDREAAEQAERERQEAEASSQPEPAVEQLPAEPVTGASPPSTSKPTNQDYQDAGRAIMALTGSYATAKAVLDAIINGDIPHIQFTGAL